MKWLLCLYPPAWQRRYRSEVQEHLRSERAGLRTALDLIAGAIDAWANPEFTPGVAAEGDRKNMVQTARCGSVEISKKEAAYSAGWMIGTCLFLVALVAMLEKALGPSIFLEALLFSSFFIALTVSSRQTFLRPYSRRARTVMIVGGIVGWYAFFLAVTALAALA